MIAPLLLDLAVSFYIRRALLILDEPVDFLDFDSTSFLYDAIQRYTERFGSVLVSSHTSELLVRCCPTLRVLENGELSDAIPTPKRVEDVPGVLGYRS